MIEWISNKWDVDDCGEILSGGSRDMPAYQLSDIF